MSHANAALTPIHRLRLARLVVEQGWPVARAAERFNVSWSTANRWADRYRLLGPAGMHDASSRPHRSPDRTPALVVRKIVHLRWKQRLGPVEIAAQVGVAPSTVHQVLVRCRINRLNHLDRVTGEQIRRYEHDHPGALIHVDVKKLGNVPRRGRMEVRRATTRPPQPLRDSRQTAQRLAQPKLGHAYIHTVLDDHSRVAYAAIHDDESKETAAQVLRNAVTGFAERGVSVERVLSDNGSCYRSHLWRDTCTELAIVHKRTRP